jgi:hypothetical protein
MPIAAVIRLILKLDSRQAFHTKAVPFYEQPIRGRVGIKKPTQKTHLKKPTENVFFLIFYGDNTNFSLSNRFFMNK